ncbi:uncharacterized protein PRD47_000106 [Ara ararauna]
MTLIADRPNNYAHYLNYGVYRKKPETQLAALLPRTKSKLLGHRACEISSSPSQKESGFVLPLTPPPHAIEGINPWFLSRFQAPALTGSAAAAASALPRSPCGLGHVEASDTACHRVGGSSSVTLLPTRRGGLKPPREPGEKEREEGGGVAGHPLPWHGGGDGAGRWEGGEVFVGRAARRERAPPSRARVPVLHGAAQPALQRELESRSAPRSASHSAAHASAARRWPAGAGHAAAAAATALRSGSGRTPREAAGGGRRAESPQSAMLPSCCTSPQESPHSAVKKTVIVKFESQH